MMWMFRSVRSPAGGRPLDGHAVATIALSLLSLLLLAMTARSDPPKHDLGTPSAKVKGAKWKPLFDGKSLDGWKITNFGGEGEVQVEHGAIVMEMGSSATGITYTKKFPKTNYEITLQASRLDGVDFFCTLTFPVGDECCSFVVGGWAGAVVGISCIDGRDASENKTTRYEKFDTNTWYQIRVRVTGNRVQTWIDDKLMADVERKGHRFSVRPEVDLSQPLGIACWETRSSIRRIRWRPLGDK